MNKTELRRNLMVSVFWFWFSVVIVALNFLAAMSTESNVTRAMNIACIALHVWLASLFWVLSQDWRKLMRNCDDQD